MSTFDFVPDVDIKITDDRLREWGLPQYQTEGSAGIDLCACIEKTMIVHPGDKPQLVSSGFCLHMKSPYMVGLIMPRSGLGHKLGLVMGNGTGVIDPDYQGEIKISVFNRSQEAFFIDPGQRIAQMVFVPIIKPRFNEVQEFSQETLRGAGGFGSTGS